ncbi:MAG: hypothetical protein IJ570_04150 [Prevotella sp.]|nr:hypothetical protein [Prevotella sp.]
MAKNLIVVMDLTNGVADLSITGAVLTINGAVLTFAPSVCKKRSARAETGRAENQKKKDVLLQKDGRK